MFANRVARIQEAMRTQGVGAVLLNPGVNMYYFTGLMKFPASYERLLTVVIPEEGGLVAVVPDLEVEGFMKGSKIKFADVKGWKQDEDPYSLARKVLEELAKAKSTIAIDGKMEYAFVYGIQRALPAVHFVDASSMLSETRLIKSMDEVELIRKAARIVCRGIKGAFESVSPGRTEIETLEVLQSEIKRHGGLNGDGCVLSGPSSALPAGQSSEKEIKKGEVVLIDANAQYEWYTGDITRTAVLGRPSDRQKSVYDVVLKAQQAACEALRPGIEARELDSLARGIITEAGFGQRFIHRLGHGLGLEIHEGPSVSERSSLTLQVGMVHTVEPGVYFPDEFGVRIEDDVAVIRDGCDNLSVGAFPNDELISL